MFNIQHDSAGGRFSTVVEGQTSLLDYKLVGNVMSINHTYVPPPIEGRGVAAELMRAALAAAATNGWKVKPVCPYAVTYLKRHPIRGTTASD